MEENDFIDSYIDAGYIGPIENCQFVTIDISKICTLKINSVSSPQKNLTGYFDININKDKPFQHYFHWSSSSEEIEIVEYLYHPESVCKFALRINGVTCFCENTYIHHDLNFLYIIFGISDIICIITLSPPDVESDYFLKQLTEAHESIRKFKFYQIKSPLLCGDFIFHDASSFQFCTGDGHHVFNYKIILPPTQPPTIEFQVGLRENRGLLTNILSVVPSYVQSPLEIIDAFSIKLSEKSLLFVFICEGINGWVVHQNKCYSIPLQQHFQNINQTKGEYSFIFSHIERSRFIMFGICMTTESLSVICIFKIHICQNQIRVLFETKFSVYSRVIAIYFNKDDIIYATNKCGISLYRSNYTKTQEHLGIDSSYQFENDDLFQRSTRFKDLFLIKLYFTNVSNRSFSKTLSFYNHFDELCDVSYFKSLNYVDTFEDSSEFDVLERAQDVYQNLLHIDNMLELSVEFAQIYFINKIVLLFLPKMGTKVFYNYKIDEHIHLKNTACIVSHSNFENIALKLSIHYNVFDEINTDALPTNFESCEMMGNPLINEINQVPLQLVDMLCDRFDIRLIEDVSLMVLSYLPSVISTQSQPEISFPLKFEKFSPTATTSIICKIIQSIALFRCSRLLMSIFIFRVFLQALSNGIRDCLYRSEVLEILRPMLALANFYLFLIQISSKYDDFDGYYAPMLCYIVNNCSYSVYNFDFSNAISELFFNSQVYFSLLIPKYIRYHEIMNSTVYRILSKFGRIPQFSQFKHMRSNFMFGKMMSDIQANNYVDASNSLILFMKFVFKYRAHGILFQSPIIALQSIGNILFTIEDSNSLNYLLSLLFNFIKVHNLGQDILDNINLGLFNYKLNKSDYTGALTVIFSLQNNPTLFSNALRDLLTKLFQNGEIRILINLNYLSAESLAYSLILGWKDSPDEPDFKTIHDILIEFRLSRKQFRDASILCFEAYSYFIHDFVCSRLEQSLHASHRYLLMSYNMLLLVENQWQFLNSESFIHPQNTLFDFPLLPNIQDIEFLLQIINAYLDLYPFFADLPSQVKTPEDLVRCLLDTHMYDCAINLCCRDKFKHLLLFIFPKIVDTCVNYEKEASYSINSPIFQRNSFHFISPSSETYAIWDWFRYVCIHPLTIEPKVAIVSALQILKRGVAIPDWLTKHLKTHAPNQHILMLLANKNYIEAGTMLIEFLKNYPIHKRFVSLNVIDNALRLIQDEHADLLNKLETSETDTILLLRISSILYKLKFFISQFKNGLCLKACATKRKLTTL